METQKLVEILKELSSFSDSINTAEQMCAAMDKYNLTFHGENFNCINTVELRHTIEKVFNISVSAEELNALLPNACDVLGMNYEPLFNPDTLSNPKVSSYLIRL